MLFITTCRRPLRQRGHILLSIRGEKIRVSSMKWMINQGKRAKIITQGIFKEVNWIKIQMITDRINNEGTHLRR
jgi:hypothetical protein